MTTAGRPAGPDGHNRPGNDGRNPGSGCSLDARLLDERLADSADELLLVDIRNPNEWQYDGRIEGARWIPMYELPSRAARELPGDVDIVLYCAHGVRSRVMVQYLNRVGFDKVCDLEGGLQAWQRAGLPVVTR